MMLLMPGYVLAARWQLGDLLEIIIVVIVVVVAPLAQWLIKYFTPKPEERPQSDVPRARPQHRQRPTAQAMPMERMPAPPMPPIRLPRTTASPLAPGSSGPAMERVRPLGEEAAPLEPVARPVVENDEASRLPEVLLEMLGVPAEEVRRQVAQERQAQQQRRQKRKQVDREAKTAAARPKMSPPPSARKSAVPLQESEKHVSIHGRLPSEGRQETVLPSRGKMQRTPESEVTTLTASGRGLSRLARAERSELRRAILLSDVLGPPVSLRGPRDFPD